ncbi:class I SAM-dependent methyltransferase [Candidatus Obscuribacterales bacterium]|nr:class I SAM-dependent methyltransferase [Candidatus Obscuribacterales bacterium]
MLSSYQLLTNAIETMTFNDHFSTQAATYRRFRPMYPKELFDYLASITPAHKRAWDCATGNGQAAVALADYFDKVTATDASEEQIREAITHPKVLYDISTAENSELDDNSQDLITIANALHWFDMDAFFLEAKRVLKKKGIIAAWCYGAFSIEDSVSSAFERIYTDLGPCWPRQINHVRDEYKSIEFPFKELDHPDFLMELDWNLAQCLGYMSSWSAIQNYRKQHGKDPIETHFDLICDAWGDYSKKRRVTWQVHLRVGRVK